MIAPLLLVGGGGPGEVDPFVGFACEVLDHLGAPHQVVQQADIGPGTVSLFARPPVCTRAEARALMAQVHAGGTIITVGGPGDLSAEIGVHAFSTVEHGHVVIEDPFKAFDVPVRAFGGVALEPARGEVLAHWELPGSPPAAVRTDVGAGSITVIGVDLWQSIVRILQGWPVEIDGVAPSDGSAPVDDGILKCDDGIALDYERDRAIPPGQPPLPKGGFPYRFPVECAHPFFHRPHADVWRTWLLRTLVDASRRAGLVLPWLDYWPAGTTAVAHLSQDSDWNDDAHAAASLDLCDELGVTTTWCHIAPGYGSEILERISRSGHEHALHFDAMGDEIGKEWNLDHLRAQLHTVATAVGEPKIVSNKNHFTRWEGWEELYLWCEELGIEIDETRGGSKPGNAGFAFGTSHVWFPIASRERGARRIDVLAMPLHSQDLSLVAHESLRDVVLDQAVLHHGLAHFLFHPVHIHDRAEVRAACRSLVEEVRQRGLSWWTSREINSWERLRRGVEVRIVAREGGGFRIEATTATAVKEASILLALPGGWDPDQLAIEGAEASVVDRHGLTLVRLQVDLAAGRNEITVEQVPA